VKRQSSEIPQPVSAPNTKNRAWCATFFGDDLAAMQEQLKDHGLESTTYGLSGLEVCPTTGKEHLQMYIRFKNAVRFNTVKELLPATAHLEAAKGNFKANFAYCTKEGSYIEWGERPSIEGHIKGLFDHYDNMAEYFGNLCVASDTTTISSLFASLQMEFEEMGDCLDDVVEWDEGDECDTMSEDDIL